MPIFEYQCDKCHKIVEVIELNTCEDHNGLPCPNCEVGCMQKIISAPAIVDRANLRIPAAGSSQRKKIS